MLAKWLLYSILTLTFWGLWGVVLKYASRGLGWQQLYFYSGLATVLAITVIAALNISGIANAPRSSAILAFLAGVFGTFGYISMARALEAGGSATSVVAITALYPAITAILAILFLGEKPSLEKILGVVMAVVAVYLLSRP